MKKIIILFVVILSLTKVSKAQYAQASVGYDFATLKYANMNGPTVSIDYITDDWWYAGLHVANYFYDVEKQIMCEEVLLCSKSKSDDLILWGPHAGLRFDDGRFTWGIKVNWSISTADSESAWLRGSMVDVGANTGLLFFHKNTRSRRMYSSKLRKSELGRITLGFSRAESVGNDVKFFTGWKTSINFSILF